MHERKGPFLFFRLARIDAAALNGRVEDELNNGLGACLVPVFVYAPLEEGRGAQSGVAAAKQAPRDGVLF